MTTIQFAALVLILVCIIGTIVNNNTMGTLSMWNVIKDTICVIVVGGATYTIMTLVFTG